MLMLYYKYRKLIFILTGTSPWNNKQYQITIDERGIFGIALNFTHDI